MKKTAYGKPLIIDQANSIVELNKVEAKSEVEIQELIFKHPSCLPISEIDETYNPAIPVCMELITPVGPLDVLMISPDGELIIIETKLWRNPEARRKVVAQILDYAKELSNWTYEDLQREVNRKLKTKGNTLYKIAHDFDSDLVPNEADFVDSVSRNLKKGKFLLLIAGDGIREGASTISEFLSNTAYLNFTLAMIELNIFTGGNLGRLIVPKILVQTVEIPKLTIELPQGIKLVYDEYDDPPSDNSTKEFSPEKERERQFYIDFWKELEREIVFDDPGQPLPTPGKGQNIYVYPSVSKKAWISAYFSKSSKNIGVYFRTRNDQIGDKISEHLEPFKNEMIAELGANVLWEEGDKYQPIIRMACDDIFDTSNREAIKDFFKTWLNNFVNTFRPRLKKLEI